MKTKVPLLLLVLLTFLQNATAINGLWLEKQDGTLVGYVFDQGLGISYKLNTVVMTTYYATVEYPFDDIKRIYFEDDVTEVASVSTTERLPQIRLTTDGVSLTGFATATPVKVYDVSGRTVMQTATNADGSLLLSISQLLLSIHQKMLLQ